MRRRLVPPLALVVASVSTLLVAGCGGTSIAVSRDADIGAARASTKAPATARPTPPEPRHTSPTAAPTLGRPVLADVDGDGRPDRAVLRRAGHDAWGRRDRLVVTTARGATLRLPLHDDGAPADRLLGSADVNGDGRAELVVFTGGDTVFGAAIVTLAGGRLREAAGRGVVPVFAAHGGACGWCTVDATCQVWRGRPRLVQTESSYLSARGRELTPAEMAATHDTRAVPDHPRKWRAVGYDLRGRRWVRVASVGGVEPSGAALPSSYRFDDALRCGTAHWPLTG